MSSKNLLADTADNTIEHAIFPDLVQTPVKIPNYLIAVGYLAGCHQIQAMRFQGWFHEFNIANAKSCK